MRLREIGRVGRRDQYELWQGPTLWSGSVARESKERRIAFDNENRMLVDGFFHNSSQWCRSFVLPPHSGGIKVTDYNTDFSDSISHSTKVRYTFGL